MNTIFALIMFLSQHDDVTDLRVLDTFHSLQQCQDALDNLSTSDIPKEALGRLKCFAMTPYQAKQEEAPVEPAKEAEKPSAYVCPERNVLGKKIGCLTT